MRRKPLLPFVLLIVIYFATRLFNLLSVPIFSDEGIYMSWGNALFDRLQREFPFYIAIDGKQTAVPITFGLVQKLPIDPLFTTRLVSIFWGAVASVASYLSFTLLFPQMRTGVFVVLLLFTPFTLFFDRLALPDVIVAASYCLAFYLTCRLCQTFTLKTCVLTGLVIGVGWWYKSSALLAIPSFLTTLLTFKMKGFISWPKLLASAAVTFVSCLLVMLPLLLQPLYQSSPMKDSLRLSLSGLGSESVFQKVVRQFADVVGWLINFVSPFTVIAFTIALVTCRKFKNSIIPLVWFAIPLVLSVLLLTQLTTRWLLMAIPPFLVLVGYTLSQNSKVLRIITYITLTYHVLVTTLLIVDPLKFYSTLVLLPALKRDLAQYFIGWTSGYGVKEAADWVLQKSRDREIIVFLRLESGNPTDALFAYLRHKPRVVVAPEQYFWNDVFGNDDFLKNPNRPDLYFVSRGQSLGNMSMVTKEVIRFPKPLDPEFIGIYKIELLKS